MKKKQHGGPGRGQGRPAGTTKADKKESITIRLTSDQREKLSILGGAKWIRQKIDEASA